MSKIQELVKYAKADPTAEYQEINFGNVSNSLAQQITMLTRIDVKGAQKVLGSFGINHAFNSHGDHSQESPRGQIGIVDSDFDHIPTVLANPDKIEKGRDNRKGNSAILFAKTINNKIYHVVMNLKHTKDGKKLVVGTMYIKKGQKPAN